MIKIVAISDTHGSYQPILDIQNKEYDADFLFHLGDYCIPDYLVAPFLAVKGNNDYSSEFPQIRNLTINGLTIHLEHGDGFKFNTQRKKYVKDINADIFIYGHTHRFSTSVMNEKTIMINPGSMTYPRDDNYGSYAVIYLDDNNKISVEKRKYPFKDSSK